MPTTRRTFLTTAGAAATGATATAGLAAPALAQSAPRKLTMVTAWPANAPGVGVNANRFAERLRRLSGGRLEIDFFAAGELVPPFEAFDAVREGTADLAHATPYYWVGKSQALHYFTGVPFGMTAVEFAAWLRFGGGQILWEEVYQPLGVLPFYAGSSGTQAGGWFNTEITSVEDFQGLKFRIAGLGGEVLRRLGAAPVLTPPGEIMPALATGTVDGADWIGPWNDIAFGLHRFAKYYYMPGFHEPGPSLEVIFNAAVFASLEPDLQEAIQTAASATALETLADFTYHNVVAFQTLLDEHGVEIRRFPDAVVERLGEESRLVLEEVAASDSLTGRVHDSYMDFLAQARAYGPHGEQGVLNMRSLAAG
ncbi:TRAP transporter substrate-binding protein [Algihabitans albus]|uniref:TRAP transporter substrate-binding protein n=1 Tax=Algihabitans albus TaxID=2164067 RepID=UPI000E5C846C|nr:TRAP transporter substrate-binding protein [Algihabitans albus]